MAPLGSIHTLLAADIGSTHCRFALFTYDAQHIKPQNSLQLQRELWLYAAQYPTFEDILIALQQSKYTDGTPFLPKHLQMASFALAGPIVNNTCTLTQLPWTASTHDIEQYTGAKKCVLLNDMAAHGYTCFTPQLLPPKLIRQGIAAPHAPLAVIGAGTGCGKCMVSQYPTPQVFPSEGGQAPFAFMGKDETAFASYLCQQRHAPYPTTDMVISGSGLRSIYAFLTQRTFDQEQSTILLQQSPLVVEWFARLYARACRSYLLETLALGGLYLTGGMVSYVPVLEHPVFWQELNNAQKHTRIIEAIPVWQMQNHHAGVFGAAIYACMT